MIDLLGRALARWLERRTGLAGVRRRALNHVFPDHWSFMIGEIRVLFLHDPRHHRDLPGDVLPF